MPSPFGSKVTGCCLVDETSFLFELPLSFDFGRSFDKLLKFSLWVTLGLDLEVGGELSCVYRIRLFRVLSLVCKPFNLSCGVSRAEKGLTSLSVPARAELSTPASNTEVDSGLLFILTGRLKSDLSVLLTLKVCYLLPCYGC